ncbi:MAG: hypothetical protein LHV69_03305 [Elusimicrobia bacterium]|nr:hypothetical protein [Candidatus Obscuribacterium magneticum]
MTAHERYLTYGICVVFLLFFGCHKKDRLSENTYTLAIDPPAVAVVKEGSQTFTARAVSAAGNFNVSPTWSVSPPAMDFLSSHIGNPVIFQPTELGDAVITATFEGTQANAQVAVVTYQPNSNTFDVYTDLLPTGADIDSDIFLFSGNITVTEMTSGYTPQGVKYQRAVPSISGAFWGVTLDKVALGKSKNLQEFSSGSLEFSIRLSRQLTTDGVNIFINNIAGSTGTVVLASSHNFLNTVSDDWQEVSIPISEFAIDTSFIKVPFGIKIDPLVSSLTFDVDAVRWQK